MDQCSLRPHPGSTGDHLVPGKAVWNVQSASSRVTPRPWRLSASVLTVQERLCLTHLATRHSPWALIRWVILTGWRQASVQCSHSPCVAGAGEPSALAWRFASLTQSFWYPWNMLTAQNRFKGSAHWPAAWEWKCPWTTHCALCVLAIAERQDAWATQRLEPTKEGRKEREKIVSLSGSFHIHFFELSRVSWGQFDGQRQVKWARYSHPCLQSQLFNFRFICADLCQLLLGGRQKSSEQHHFRKNKEYESLIEHEAELLASNVTNYIDWVKHGWLRTASYWLIYPLDSCPWFNNPKIQWWGGESPSLRCRTCNVEADFFCLLVVHLPELCLLYLSCVFVCECTCACMCAHVYTCSSCMCM